MTTIQINSGAIDASDCIGRAWNLVTSKLGLYIGVGLLTMVLIGCIPIANIILLGPVLGGFYYLVMRDMDGEPVDFGMMFKGFEKFVPLMVIGVIQAIPGIIMQVVQWTVDIGRLINLKRGSGTGDFDFYQAADPGIGGLDAGFFGVYMVFVIVFMVISLIWAIGFYFALPVAMEHNVGPMAAIGLSFRAAFQNLGGLILLIILEVLVVLLGLIALCVGLLVAIPVVYAANVFAYRMIFPRSDMNYRTTPPPPSAYGNFGQGA